MKLKCFRRPFLSVYLNLNDMERIHHAFEPVFNEESRVLILGTMPSPKSREQGFYYSHPRNRFWPVMAVLFNGEIPKTSEEKKAFALEHKFALWDVLSECDINGASDSSIKNAIPNDLSTVLKNSSIKTVFTTGATAYKLYQKLIYPKTGIEALPLPSTSPANAKMSLENLVGEYKIILEYLKPSLCTVGENSVLP